MDFWKWQATYLEFISRNYWGTDLIFCLLFCADKTSWRSTEGGKKKNNRKPRNHIKYESSVAAQPKSQRAAASAACLRVGARASHVCTCLFVCLVDPQLDCQSQEFPPPPHTPTTPPPGAGLCVELNLNAEQERRALCLHLSWCVTPPRPSLRNRCMRTKRTPRTCRLFTPAASHGMTQSVRQTLGQTRAATHGSSCSRLPVDGNPLVSQSDRLCTCTVSSFLNQNSVSTYMSFIWYLSVFSIPARSKTVGAPVSLY